MRFGTCIPLILLLPGLAALAAESVDLRVRCGGLGGDAYKACVTSGGKRPEDFAISFFDAKGAARRVPLAHIEHPCPDLVADGEYKLYRSKKDRLAGKVWRTVTCKGLKEQR